MKRSPWYGRYATLFLLKRQPNKGTRRSLVGLSGILLAGLSLLGFLALGSPTQTALAQFANTRTATSTSWQGASFPVENFVAYTSPFGYRRSATGGYGSEFHSGLDIAAPMGSYVRSWWTGRVDAVIQDGRCGTGLAIESGNWRHIYCHMIGNASVVNGVRSLVDREGNVLIQEGQVIPGGSRIGRVGMTGRTTGPHLHWGLKYSGEWVDPAIVLRAMYGEQRDRQVSQR